jgi:hypothetical protein
MTKIPELTEKNADTKKIARKALEDPSFFSGLLKALTAKDDTIRFNSFQSFLYLSEKYPEKVYPHWDMFASLLTSNNAYHKYMGIYIIAQLVQHDAKQKFQSLFDTYFGLLEDKSVIPPSHVAKNAGTIVKAYPHLKDEITKRLLSIDKIHHEPGRKALIKGYIIEAFDDYFEMITDNHRIFEFVKEQLESESPRTRRAAQNFLERWDHE